MDLSSSMFKLGFEEPQFRGSQDGSAKERSSASLPTLAVELIETIVCHLDFPDLCTLRSLCKDLNFKTLNYFGTECCTTAQTDLSHLSLQNLQTISDSVDLAFYVKCLHITPIKAGWIWKIGDLKHYPIPQLVAPVTATEILRKIFGKLVNCNSLDIDVEAAFKRNPVAQGLQSGEAVGVLLALVAEGSLALNCLKVETEEGPSRLDYNPTMMPSFDGNKPVGAWGYLKEFSLTIDQFQDSNHDWAVDLITRARQLEKLTLRFHCRNLQFFGHLGRQHSLCRLEKVDLCRAELTYHVLSRLLLSSSNTLRILQLSYADLENEGAWILLFKTLADGMSCLERITMASLQQERWTRPRYIWERHCLHFPGLRANPTVPGSQKSMPSCMRRGDLVYAEKYLLAGMTTPVMIDYKISGDYVWVVDYTGPEVKILLNKLAETAEWP